MKKKGMKKILRFLTLLLLLLFVALPQARGQVKRIFEKLDSAHGQRSEVVVSEVPDTYRALIHILDVGQGSAALIESGGEFMLIDGADADYSSYVVAYLKARGVQKLKYVIATHYDADHINGIVGALNVFEVETIMGPDYAADTHIYSSLMNTIDEKGYDMIHPQVGDEYHMGLLKFTILGPCGTEYEDENSYSIAVRITDGNSSVLIAGDATAVSEAEMVANAKVNDQLSLASDIYVVNHHGSSTSSSGVFVKAVSPSYLVISCGKGNEYGHPHSSVMKTLENSGAALFRTDLQGDILFAFTWDGIVWMQEAVSDWSVGVGDGSQSENGKRGKIIKWKPLEAGLKSGSVNAVRSKSRRTI